MSPEATGATISEDLKTVTGKFTEDTTITATYENLISDEQQEGFVAVTFDTGTNGTIKDSTETTKTVYVKPNVQVDLTGKAPEVTAKDGKKFMTWDKGLVATFTEATTINAVYNDTISDTEIDGYTKIVFVPGTNGKFVDGDAEKSIWVDPEQLVDLQAKADKFKALLVEDTNYSFTQWENPVGTEADFTAKKYAETTTFTAAYESNISDEAKEGFVEVKFLPGTNGKFNPEADSKSVWVKPNVEVDLTAKAPIVEANDNYGFTGWSQDLKATFAVATEITAQYSYNGDNVIPVPDPTNPPEKPEGFVTVKFEAGVHGQITEGTTEYYVKKDTLVSLTAPTVEAEDDYKHTGWNSALTRSFSDDVTTITAQYKAKVVTEDPGDGDYVKVSFTTSKGSLKGTTNYWVLRNEKVSLTAPEVEGLTDYTFKAWDPEVKESYGADTEHKAIFDYTGQDIVPQKPGEGKPQVPADYVKVEFKPGDHGTIANTETTIYWVNPNATPVKTLEAIAKPTVKAADGWTHTGWDRENATEITGNLEVIASYKATVVTIDPGDSDYVKVDFSAETKGSFEGNQVTEYWVLKGERVSLEAPTVTPKGSYAFTGWDPQLATSYNEATTHRAQYSYNGDNVIPVPDPTNPQDKPEGFVTVKFEAGDHGQITEGTTEYYVKKDTLVSLTAPTVEADEAYEHTGWNSALTRSFSDDVTTITANYEEITVPEPEQFTIKYLSMDTEMGTVTTATETVTSAEQIQGSKATPTDADKYEFVRWMNVEDPTDASLTAETIKPTEAKNATYIAIFKATEPEPTNEFTIWYVPVDSTMGSVSLDKETITDGQTIQGSTATANDGYQFIKWIDAEGNKVSEEAKLTPSVTESTVFVAVFKEIPVEPTKHTVSFSANDGQGSMDAIEVLEGDYTLPVSSFTRDGYNFTGWKVDGEGDTLKAGQTIQVKKDIELVAQWEEIQVTPEPTIYTVTYESGAQDATGTMAQDTARENEKYTVLRNGFQYTDHEFTGWLIEETKTIVQPGDRIDVDQNVTLVAQWKEVSVTPEPTEKVTINYEFKAADGSRLPSRVTNLLPRKDFVDEGSTVKAPVVYDNVRVYDNDGYWTFVAWKPSSFTEVQKGRDYTFVGTWKWNADEKPTPDPKPDKPGGDFVPGWRPDEKPEIKETGRHNLYIKGYPDGTIRPDRQITRAEAATMIARLEGLDMSNSLRPEFKDVESSWYNSAINAVTAKGLMQGYPDGSFKANAPITRAEFAQLIKNINDKSYVNKGLPFEDVRGHWGYLAIDKAYGTGLITGYPDGTFRPDRQITRAEVARIVNKLYDRSVDETGLLAVVTKTERFVDLNRSHWAYYDLIEASNTHNYVRREEGKVMENWLEILK